MCMYLRLTLMFIFIHNIYISNHEHIKRSNISGQRSKVSDHSSEISKNFTPKHQQKKNKCKHSSYYRGV